MIEMQGHSVPAVALLIMLFSFLLQVLGHKLSEPVTAAHLFHGFVGAPFLELSLRLMKLFKLVGINEAGFWSVFGDTTIASMVGYEKCSGVAAKKANADVCHDADIIRKAMIRS